MYGKICEFWVELGEINSTLGYPLTDPQFLSDGTTCVIFEGGHIHHACGSEDAVMFVEPMHICLPIFISDSESLADFLQPIARRLTNLLLERLHPWLPLCRLLKIPSPPTKSCPPHFIRLNCLPNRPLYLRTRELLGIQQVKYPYLDLTRLLTSRPLIRSAIRPGSTTATFVGTFVYPGRTSSISSFSSVPSHVIPCFVSSPSNSIYSNRAASST